MTDNSDFFISAPYVTSSGSFDTIQIRGFMDPDGNHFVSSIESPDSFGEYDPPIPLTTAFTQEQWKALWLAFWDYCFNVAEEGEDEESDEEGGEDGEEEETPETPEG